MSILQRQSWLGSYRQCQANCPLNEPPNPSEQLRRSRQGRYCQGQANFSDVCRWAATDRRSNENRQRDRAHQTPENADNIAEYTSAHIDYKLANLPVYDLWLEAPFPLLPTVLVVEDGRAENYWQVLVSSGWPHTYTYMRGSYSVAVYSSYHACMTLLHHTCADTGTMLQQWLWCSMHAHIATCICTHKIPLS